MIKCSPFMILNMVLLIGLFLLSLAVPLLQILLDKDHKNCSSIHEILLKYSLFFNIGCLFMLGFAGHIIYSSEIASSLSWNWSPFQYELSFSELALAILGLISCLFNHHFWLATIICSVIWLLGASGVHIYYDLFYGSDVIAQGAFVVYWNIFISLWIVGLYILYHKNSQLSFKELFCASENNQNALEHS